MRYEYMYPGCSEDLFGVAEVHGFGKPRSGAVQVTVVRVAGVAFSLSKPALR